MARADALQLFLLALGIGGLCFFLLGRSSFREAGVLASLAGSQGFFDIFHGAGRNALIALSFTLAWTVFRSPGSVSSPSVPRNTRKGDSWLRPAFWPCSMR